MPNTLDVKVDDSQREYFSTSAKVADSFGVSPLSGLAARIMDSPDREDLQHLRLKSGSRKVYRVGEFQHDGAKKYGVLKFDLDPCRPAQHDYMLRPFFEGFLFSIMRRFSNDDPVPVPSFCFGVERKGIRGVVMEDVSQGGAYKVSMLDEDARLPFAKDGVYEFERRQVLRVLSKRLMWLDMLAGWNSDTAINSEMGALAERHHETMCAVIHDQLSPKGFYLIDADQVWTTRKGTPTYGDVWTYMIAHEIKNGMEPKPLLSL